MSDHAAPRDGEKDDSGRDLDAEFAALMGNADLEFDAVPTAEGEHLDLGGEISAAELGSLEIPDDAAELLEDHPLVTSLKVSVLITPLTRPEHLAILLAQSGVDGWAVPTAAGALFVIEKPSIHAEWSMAELTGEDSEEDAEVVSVVEQLSQLSRRGIIVINTELATDVGAEKGLSGQMSARRYQAGQAAEELSPGLILASAEPELDDILFGFHRAADMPGVVSTEEILERLRQANEVEAEPLQPGASQDGRFSGRRRGWNFLRRRGSRSTDSGSVERHGDALRQEDASGDAHGDAVAEGDTEHRQTGDER